MIERNAEHAMNFSTVSVRRSWLFGACLAVAVVPTAGCGVEAYEARMQDRMKTLELAGKFGACARDPMSVVDPAKPVGVDVTLRRPLLFGPRVLNEQSGDPNQPSKPIPKDRVQPPFLEIPGFQLTFEELRRSGENGMRPISFYVGVQPTDPASLDKIPADLKKAFPESEISWKVEKVLKPDGSYAEWKSISAAGPMGFYTPGYGVSEALPGKFALYVREEAGHQVFLAVRGADGAAETGQAVEALKVVAGTVRVAKKTTSAK